MGALLMSLAMRCSSACQQDLSFVSACNGGMTPHETVPAAKQHGPPPEVWWRRCGCSELLQLCRRNPGHHALFPS